MTSVDQPDELENRFLKAVNYVNKHATSMVFEELIPLYGYYKQATVGPCGTPKPSIFNMKAKIMWKSWSNLGTLCKEEAMRYYVEHLSRVVENWDTSSHQTKDQGWISVSSPSREDEDIPDSAKDVFDWVKEGDLDNLKQFKKKFSVNLRDDSGLTVLHWAADRGHLQLVKYLILEMNADVNCLDGDEQTPLHYAAACGHFDVCKFLVDSQASVTAKDRDGLSPIDVAEESVIKELLRGPKYFDV